MKSCANTMIPNPERLSQSTVILLLVQSSSQLPERQLSIR